MASRLDIEIGQRFGHLTIIKEVCRKQKYRRRFLVKCDCGTIKEVNLQAMLSGGTRSCGCQKGKKHGMSRTRIYKINLILKSIKFIFTSIN